MIKVYISGPMRHWPDSNRAAFDSMAEKLRGMDLEVFNPASNPTGLTLAEYMSLDLQAVHACDMVLVLQDWDCSRGAVLEVMTARILDKPIYKAADYICGIETPVPLSPAESAYKACTESMREGLGHGSGVWKIEPMPNHSLKASRHLLTAQLMKEGLQHPDSEGYCVHARNAVCRASMLLVQLTGATYE